MPPIKAFSTLYGVRHAKGLRTDHGDAYDRYKGWCGRGHASMAVSADHQPPYRISCPWRSFDSRSDLLWSFNGIPSKDERSFSFLTDSPIVGLITDPP